MSGWWSVYRERRRTAEAALAPVGNGWRIYMQGIAQVPEHLLFSLCDRATSLTDLRLYHLHTVGPAPQLDLALRGRLRDVSLFVGPNVRDAVNQGLADHLPVHLSEAELLFLSGRIPLDAVLVQVTPPDARGLVSLGLSVEAVRGAMTAAPYVVAQVNDQVPWTNGDALVPVEAIDAFVEREQPLMRVGRISNRDDGTMDALGRNVASLVENGACLQLGIGAAPNAVTPFLREHRDLGIHTELLSDGLMDLVGRGVATGRDKALDANVAVASFIEGSRHLYGEVANNPHILLRSLSYTNDPHVISRNARVVSVNAALEVDLGGQVAAESLGPIQYSGVGGQADFARGASLSLMGKAIIALPSTARTPEGVVSRIVASLHLGASVTTDRSRVDYVVTEYGVASLRGKTLAERARALIAIAHPSFREELARGAMTPVG